jgi:two-component system invasion response regulator UvrY
MLVDDHDLVRIGFTRLLSDVKGITVVGEARSGEDAVKLAKAVKPDVVLMDVKMPGIGGLEATRKILRLLPDTKIIAVTVYGDEPYPSRFLQAGASGYITKGSSLEEMVKAIRTVFNGQRYLSSEVAQVLALKHFNEEEGSPFDTLSARELQVMMMITSGQKVQDISDSLCLSAKTVNSYRYRLFEKLGVASDVELTHLAIRHGLIDTDDAEEDLPSSDEQDASDAKD